MSKMEKITPNHKQEKSQTNAKLTQLRNKTPTNNKYK